MLSNTQLRIHPVNCATDFGVKTITIKLEDQEPLSSAYSFNINVPNLRPSFTGGLMPVDQTVKFGQIKTYTIPSYSDPEYCPSITVTF